MKRIYLCLFAIWVAGLSFAQKKIDIATGELSSNLDILVSTRDITEIPEGYRVTYDFSEAIVQPDDLYEGSVFWKMKGFGLNETVGEPCYLLRNDMFVIPKGADVEITVEDCSYVDYPYELTPARPPLLNSSDEVYTKDNVLPIAMTNVFYPTSVVECSNVQSYRGTDVCYVQIRPIQYNSSARTVRAYTSISYKMTFKTSVASQSSVKAKSVKLSAEDNFLRNAAVNGSLVDNGAMRATSNTSISDVRDYLIVSTSKFEAAVNRFADWKRMLGFNVHVKLKDSWTPDLVKSTIKEVYNEVDNLYYLLIVGDHEDVPGLIFPDGGDSDNDHIPSYVTDFYYGCMDDDLIPDIYQGRMSVSTLAEANIVVDKVIGYEQTPPLNENFYKKGINCSCFQDDLPDRDGFDDRRFAQTSEEIRDYLMEQGKEVQRIYYTDIDVTPMFWNKGEYSYGESIPEELKRPTFEWNGGAAQITEAINNGVFYVFHRDHGTPTEWGEPYYTKKDILSLTNSKMLPVIFSMNCQTGMYNHSTNVCFAECFLRKNNGGCVGIYAATQISFSGYNDVLSVGMFDAIWPSPGLSVSIPKMSGFNTSNLVPSYTLGQILNQGMVRVNEVYANKKTDKIKYTKEIFHCFGDPSMQIYTMQPTAFEGVLVNRGTDRVSVELKEEEAARITLYDPVADKLESYMGNIVDFSTSHPEEVRVCVSAHNKIPYMDDPDVLYIQNTNISGKMEEVHDVIKVGSNVTSDMSFGNVTTTNADITLRAKKVVLDKGTSISKGTTLKIIK